MIGDVTFYQVNSNRGFLPIEDPLECLPSEFETWEYIAAEVPTLLMTSKLRSTLEKLKPLDTSRLESEPYLRRAMLVLGVFASAYVWGESQSAITIPKGIAIPLWEMAEKIGLPPILCYTSVTLDNWRRLDKNQPIELLNIAALQLFWGGIDEQWFYLISVAIEAKGALAIKAIVEAQKAVANSQFDILTQQLKKIASVIIDMQVVLLQIQQKCDPYIFYHRVRPFFAGWPEAGIIYEGISDKPHKFFGSSAAQSSLIQSLDAGLGIVHHQDQTLSFLQAMRYYMPPAHRRFIEALEAESSIRQFVLNHKQNHPALRDLYNECIQVLNNFRKEHRLIAASYILRQNPQQIRGTGGTNFVPFLKQVEMQTQASFIN
jgi:indoleamine 2,3-dioxygenase